jgi:hypothetical protein
MKITCETMKCIGGVQGKYKPVLQDGQRTKPCLICILFAISRRLRSLETHIVLLFHIDVCNVF